MIALQARSLICSNMWLALKCWQAKLYSDIASYLYFVFIISCHFTRVEQCTFEYNMNETTYRAATGSGIQEKFRNSKVLFSRPLKVWNLSLGREKLILVGKKLDFLCLRASFMRSANIPCHRQRRFYSKCWLVDSRPFHPWWPMKLCLTNPWSISFKDGGNLVLLSSGDDFWRQLPSLLFV